MHNLIKLTNSHINPLKKIDFAKARQTFKTYITKTMKERTNKFKQRTDKEIPSPKKTKIGATSTIPKINFELVLSLQRRYLKTIIYVVSRIIKCHQI